MDKLKLVKEIGRGKERACFVHPQDRTKIIKVVHASTCKQMKRELSVYDQIADKPNINYKHMPMLHTQVDTDKGTGYVFDLVENSDGTSAKPLHWFLKHGSRLKDFYPQLKALKAYFLQHAIVFCRDMSFDGNILVKEEANGSKTLVVVDGLGDVTFIQWPNRFDCFARKKIERRWDWLMGRLEQFDAEHAA